MKLTTTEMIRTSGGRRGASLEQEVPMSLSRFVKLASCGAAFVSLLAVTTATAQGSAEESGGAAVESTAAESAPPELVYAASRAAQTLAEAPASVTLVTREEIDAFGWQTLGEILDSVVGMYYQQDRSYDYVTVRGLTTLGDYGSRILVMLNGKRVNRATFESSGFGHDGLVDVSAIERVEVIRGAGSSMYGTNALYAVVNVVTRLGRSVAGGEVEAGVGSFSSYDGDLTFGGTGDGGLDYLIGLSAYHAAGDDLYFPEFDDPATNHGVAEGRDGEVAYHGLGQVAFGDFTFDAACFDHDKEIPTGAYSTMFNDPFTAVHADQTVAAVSYEHAFLDLSRVLASLTYSASTETGDWAYDGFQLREFNEDAVWTLDGQYQLHFGDHSLTVGGEARRVDSRLEAHDVEPFFQYYDETHTIDNRAVFAQGELHFGKRWSVVAGLRYDWYETIGATTNPRFAAVYKLGRDSSVKLMYNEAFRAPNPAELYYADYITWKPSEGLGPETTRSYEVAFERGLAGGFRGAISLYDIEVDDLIALTTDPADDMFVYRNLDRLESQGAELEVSGPLFGRLRTRLSYAYQDATNGATGDTPAGSPRQLGRLGVAGSFFGGRGSASVELRYVGDRPRRDGATEDAFLTVGGRVRFDLLDGDRLTLVADVDNLFDTDYAHVVGDEHVQQVIAMDGVTGRLALRARF